MKYSSKLNYRIVRRWFRQYSDLLAVLGLGLIILTVTIGAIL